MGCRSYTGIELFGPIPSLRAVQWINFALSTDDRIRDPISGKSEWIVFHNRIKARNNGQELALSPCLKGTWFMGKVPKVNKKVMTNKEAIDVLKKSPALKNKKGEVAIGLVAIIALSVYLTRLIHDSYSTNKTNESRMSVVHSKMIKESTSWPISTISLKSSQTTVMQFLSQKNKTQ
jgi:hypothetical protein